LTDIGDDESVPEVEVSALQQVGVATFPRAVGQICAKARKTLLQLASGGQGKE
jgi:hypothetical protein